MGEASKLNENRQLPSGIRLARVPHLAKGRHHVLSCKIPFKPPPGKQEVQFGGNAKAKISKDHLDSAQKDTVGLSDF